MKKLKLICTIFFSVLLLSACEKKVNSEVNRQEPTKEYTKESGSKEKVMASTRAAIKISCDGTCDGSERLCGMRVQGLPVEYIECDCEGCAMGFSSVAGLPYDETLSSYFDYVVSDVDNHFSKNYLSQQVSISSIFIYELTNNKVVIQVNYENPVNSIESDVTFELEFNESSEMVKKQ